MLVDELRSVGGARSMKGRCSVAGSEWHFGGDEGPECGR
jgi:hypothetical protein